VKSGSRVIEASAWKPEDHLDPARIAKLNVLLAATGAEVVISSSWRNAHKRPRLVALLEGAGFVGRVIGQTPWMVGHERHVEIKRWLSQQVPEVERFVILDDDQDAGVGFGHHYVFVCDGLEDEHVERARRVLE
jgi:hypothetical protein